MIQNNKIYLIECKDKVIYRFNEEEIKLFKTLYDMFLDCDNINHVVDDLNEHIKYNLKLAFFNDPIIFGYIYRYVIYSEIPKEKIDKTEFNHYLDYYNCKYKTIKTCHTQIMEYNTSLYDFHHNGEFPFIFILEEYEKKYDYKINAVHLKMFFKNEPSYEEIIYYKECMKYNKYSIRINGVESERVRMFYYDQCVTSINQVIHKSTNTVIKIYNRSGSKISEENLINPSNYIRDNLRIYNKLGFDFNIKNFKNRQIKFRLTIDFIKSF